MKTVFLQLKNLDLELAREIDTWLHENVGNPLIKGISWDTEGIELFQEGNYDYVLIHNTRIFEFVFKDDAKAMLFKLTWC
jgi:hypothetical protein